MNVRRILFVCTGNSCRSVMAERLMRQALARAGLDEIQVESAGAFGIEGMPATRETQRVLLEVGIDASDHRAKTLTTEMIEEADLILVMEPFHGEEVSRRSPQAKSKVHLLKTFRMTRPADEPQPGIPDPIGKPLEVYEVCFTEIREAINRVTKTLEVQSH